MFTTSLTDVDNNKLPCDERDIDARQDLLLSISATMLPEKCRFFKSQLYGESKRIFWKAFKDMPNAVLSAQNASRASFAQHDES